MILIVIKEMKLTFMKNIAQNLNSFYDNLITEDTVNDPKKLTFLREFAACFGQISQQLFFEPHKSRSVPIQI